MVNNYNVRVGSASAKTDHLPKQIKAAKTTKTTWLLNIENGGKSWHNTVLEESVQLYTLCFNWLSIDLGSYLSSLEGRDFPEERKLISVYHYENHSRYY